MLQGVSTSRSLLCQIPLASRADPCCFTEWTAGGQFFKLFTLSFFLLYYFIIRSFYYFSFHTVINLYLIRKYIFKGLCLCVFFHSLPMVFFTHILWSLPFSFSPDRCFLLSPSPPSLSLPSSVTWKKKSFSIPFKIFVVHFRQIFFYLFGTHDLFLSPPPAMCKDVHLFKIQISVFNVMFFCSFVTYLLHTESMIYESISHIHYALKQWSRFFFSKVDFFISEVGIFSLSTKCT